MAKDDNSYLVFKILTYLYGCFKCKYKFDQTAFDKQIKTKDVPEEYLTNVLRYMQQDGLIDGLKFIRPWGNDYILTNDVNDAAITTAGIEYVSDNSKMKKIRDAVIAEVGAISGLVGVVFGG